MPLCKPSLLLSASKYLLLPTACLWDSCYWIVAFFYFLHFHTEHQGPFRKATLPPWQRYSWAARVGHMARRHENLRLGEFEMLSFLKECKYYPQLVAARPWLSLDSPSYIRWVCGVTFKLLYSFSASRVTMWNRIISKGSPTATGGIPYKLNPAALLSIPKCSNAVWCLSLTECQ